MSISINSEFKNDLENKFIPSVDDVNYEIIKHYNIENENSDDDYYYCNEFSSFIDISDELILSTLILKKKIPDQLIRIIVQYCDYVRYYDDMSLLIINKINYTSKYNDIQTCDNKLLKYLKFARYIYNRLDLPNTKEDKFLALEKIILFISLCKDRKIPTNPFKFYNTRPFTLQFSRFFVELN